MHSTLAQRRRGPAVVAGAFWAAHSLCRRQTPGWKLRRALALAWVLRVRVHLRWGRRWCRRAAWGIRELSAPVSSVDARWLVAGRYHLIEAF